MIRVLDSAVKNGTILKDSELRDYWWAACVFGCAGDIVVLLVMTAPLSPTLRTFLPLTKPRFLHLKGLAATILPRLQIRTAGGTYLNAHQPPTDPGCSVWHDGYLRLS